MSQDERNKLSSLGDSRTVWLTAAWSITMASAVNHLPITTPAFYLSLFALGAVIMRGAGCTINDMWDRKYDLAVGESLFLILSSLFLQHLPKAIPD